MKITILLMMFCSTYWAQEPRFVYPVPAADTFTKTEAIYRKAGDVSLGLDLYRPVAVAGGQSFPVLIIFNGFGGSFMRTSAQAQDWAKAATAHSFAAVTEETTLEHLAEDFDALVTYLTQHAKELHVDPDRISVIAWSGNVYAGLPVVENPERRSIKAAVFYYGSADVKQFRLDTPVLFVRAGLDQPMTNRLVDQFLAAALAANAPWTLLNYPAGHHAFDIVDDNDLSRDAIEQTFQFLQLALSNSYQTGIHAGMPEASAASALATGDYARAVSLYGALAQSRPQDYRVLLAYGNALVGAKRYREARVQFDRVKAIGNAGARDLAIPAARACALDNDPKAAIEWLKTIPPQFLRDSIQSDPAFARLKGRPDFLALFQKQ